MDVIRQLQQAILLTQSRDQQPLTVPMVNVQTSNQNVGLTPVNPRPIATGTAGAAAQKPTPEYSYKVKIINPNKKSDVVVRQLNRFTSEFKAVMDVRMKLIEEFQEQVPNTVDFTIGYFDGCQSAKIWLVTSDDLRTMYKKYPAGGNLSLWCEGRSVATSDSTHAPKRKRDGEASSSSTSRQEKEEEVESIYKELREKHTSKYDTPRLRLWSRMIAGGLHDDYESPPNIPAFSGNIAKRPRKDGLCDAMSSAAVAFADAIKDKSQEKPTTAVQVLPTGHSPG